MVRRTAANGGLAFALKPTSQARRPFLGGAIRETSMNQTSSPSRGRRATLRIAAGAFALGALPILSGCDRKATESAARASAPATAEATKPFAGQTVTVAVGSFMSSGVNMFKDEWEKRTGARLQVVEIPFGDLYQRLFASFTTGAGEFDVAIYASNWIPEFALNKNILSLEKYYGSKDNWDDVLDKTKRIMYVGSERYSVPLDGDVLIG